jgi:dihydroneopterin aldolase
VNRGRDSIYVQGIEFEGAHGYTAAERKVTRRFRCHIAVERDLAAAARSDRIQESVDYRALCSIALEIGTHRTFRLLEGLAGAIADALDARWPGLAITVTVEKLAPPCPGTPSVAGVTLYRNFPVSR